MMWNKLLYSPLFLGLLVLAATIIDQPTSVENIASTNTQYPNFARRVELDKGRLSFDVYFVNLDNSKIAFYHKDANGKKIKNIKSLKAKVEKNAQKLPPGCMVQLLIIF